MNHNDRAKYKGQRLMVKSHRHRSLMPITGKIADFRGRQASIVSRENFKGTPHQSKALNNAAEITLNSTASALPPKLTLRAIP